MWTIQYNCWTAKSIHTDNSYYWLNSCAKHAHGTLGGRKHIDDWWMKWILTTCYCLIQGSKSDVMPDSTTAIEKRLTCANETQPDCIPDVLHLDCILIMTQIFWTSPVAFSVSVSCCVFHCVMHLSSNPPGSSHNLKTESSVSEAMFIWKDSLFKGPVSKWIWRNNSIDLQMQHI